MSEEESGQGSTQTTNSPKKRARKRTVAQNVSPEAGSDEAVGLSEPNAAGKTMSEKESGQDSSQTTRTPKKSRKKRTAVQETSLDLCGVEAEVRSDEGVGLSEPNVADKTMSEKKSGRDSTQTTRTSKERAEKRIVVQDTSLEPGSDEAIVQSDEVVVHGSEAVIRSDEVVVLSAPDVAGKTAPEKNSSRGSTLTTRNLRKRYKKRTVVQDASLEVRSGEVVGLLGPNGAGKTTCFYMVVGLIACDGGDVYLDDRKITHLPIHQRAKLGVSYLPQEASVFRKLTVIENIKAVLELRHLPAGEVEQRAEQLLEELHIAHIRNSSAASLSGGERRRVEIARALSTDPRFILLDEPFAGVDPIAVLDIQKIIRFLKERDIGVLITDHNVRETLGICDHAYILNEGGVLAAGRPDEIIYNENVRKVYLGENFRL
ncbi:hypothetical protein AGMMS50256_00430 [Betaproteobacteria bacterium]|nr:hypothetical protein AGMMS50256_00430 [Betaproteobacteria bacterium]